MNVVFNDTFESLVKAAILKEIKGYTPTKSYTLNCITTDKYSLNELLVEWNWAKGTPRNITSLKPAIKLALMHRYVDYDLIFKVITQALTYGVDYVLTRKSKEAHTFCNMIYSVRKEIRDAKLNIKFINKGKCLIGKCFLKHKTSNILKEFYQKRFPEKMVIIQTPFFNPS